METSTGCYTLPLELVSQIRSAPPKIMNLREGAAYLTCSPRKLRDLVAARRIQSARIGTKIVIRREWLDAFLGS